jgi:hypothetical protein
MADDQQRQRYIHIFDLLTIMIKVNNKMKKIYYCIIKNLIQNDTYRSRFPFYVAFPPSGNYTMAYGFFKV